jgi:hypothetical protein
MRKPKFERFHNMQAHVTPLHRLDNLIEQAVSEFRLICFDNVDVADLPRNADTARFAIKRLEHLGGRKGFLLACQFRQTLADLGLANDAAVDALER